MNIALGILLIVLGIYLMVRVSLILKKSIEISEQRNKAHAVVFRDEWQFSPEFLEMLKNVPTISMDELEAMCKEEA